MVARLLLLLPLGLLLAACGSAKDDRIRELEEQLAQLEDENAQLRKGIVPADTGPGAVPVDPGDAPVWGGKTGEAEEVEEIPPPAELVPVDAEEEPPEVTPEPETPTPAPPPAGDEADAPAEGGPALTVYRAVMARDVSDRAPVGEGTSFPASVGKVYCFSEVGPAPGVGQTNLIHRWSRDGEALGETKLRVAGDHWRTFSNRSVSEAKKGAWQVELVDERGNVLRTLRFTIE